jgi:hypothetical protein
LQRADHLTGWLHMGRVQVAAARLAGIHRGGVAPAAKAAVAVGAGFGLLDFIHILDKDILGGLAELRPGWHGRAAAGAEAERTRVGGAAVGAVPDQLYETK